VPRASAISAVAAATSRLMRVARPKSALVKNASNQRSEMRVGGKARLGHLHAGMKPFIAGEHFHPAVVHVNGSGRLQTVSRDANPLYWQLLRSFGALTGVPVLLNTSFNENEPIVLKPAEALDCFLRTGMDALALGRTVIVKRPEI